MQLANIVFRRVLESQGMTRVYDNHFNLSKVHLKLPDAEVFSGVISEISNRLVGGKTAMYLSLDPSHKVVSTISVLSLLKTSDHAANALRGTRVMTRHNFTAYGVEGIDKKQNPTSTFTMTDRKTGAETQISYVDYYKSQGVVIKDLRQPLLISTGRMGARIYLIPELCVPASVPNAAKAKLPQLTSLKPTARAARINDLLKLVTDVSAKKLSLAQYGLQVTPEPVAVNSTQLAPPKIVFSPKTTKTPGSEWRRDASAVRWDASITKLKVYPVVVYDNEMFKEDGFTPLGYWTKIKDQLSKMGAPLDLQKDTLLPYKPPAQKTAALRPLLDMAIGKLPKGVPPSQVLVIAFVAETLHYEVYRTFCLDHGFIGQALNCDPKAQFNKMDPKNGESILGNIARQIVNKFSIASWWYTIPDILPNHKDKVFLTIGMDVFHASPKLVEDKQGNGVCYWQKRSIVAYCAKLAFGAAKPLFFCDTETRDAGAEIAGQKVSSTVPSQDLESPGAAHLRQHGSASSSAMQPNQIELRGANAGPLAKFVHDCLTQWQPYIKDPSKLVIIVYRDGVADSQMDQVDATEVAQLNAVAPENAHVIYSIVQKRVHNRFVMSDAGNFGNCAPGTVVEDLARDSATRPNFFMVPCLTNLSTNKPVHYTITFNSHPQALSRSDFYAISYAAHHTYQNWAGTVKVPDVCQCAHTLAYTLGECGIDDPIVPTTLKPSLFFL